MRGTKGNAVEALRAYACEIEAAVDNAAPVRVDRSYQSETVSPSASKGTTPLLPLAVVSFVLVGAVAFAAVMATNGAGTPDPAAPTATPAVDLPVSSTNRQVVPNAQRAVHLLTSRGLTETAATVQDLITSGTANDPSVAATIAALHAVVTARPSMSQAMLASDPAVLAATYLLEMATRPPGLDPDRTVPGHGGQPPGQDDTFTPPGQDDTFTPPGQDDTFTPPGQDDTFTPPGQDDTFTPPGQDKSGLRNGTSDR
ncbi:MAG: hypothetical protein ACR2N9_04390 [Acidimicrobiia bacterium]